jgi:hypothetical protein
MKELRRSTAISRTGCKIQALFCIGVREFCIIDQITGGVICRAMVRQANALAHNDVFYAQAMIFSD